jgi:hypothetical protein
MLDLHGVPQVTTGLYRPPKSGVPNVFSAGAPGWFIVVLKEFGTKELRHGDRSASIQFQFPRAK